MNYWFSIGDKLLSNIIGMTNPSWQQLTLILGMLIIILFRSPISQLISNIKKISIRSIECYRQTAFTRLSNEEIGGDKDTLKTRTLLETIKTNKDSIETYLSNNDLTDADKAKKYLISEYAHILFILKCERVYFLIFGSQIELLRNLRQSSSGGLPKEDIDQHFNNSAMRFPDLYKDLNSDDYTKFLIEANLVEIKSNIYQISSFGKDFLTWFEASGLLVKCF